jgi:hypothetical protein
MLIVRVRRGAVLELGERDDHIGPIYAFIFLMSPEHSAGTHHRILSRLSLHAGRPDFLVRWGRASGEKSIKALLGDSIELVAPARERLRTLEDVLRESRRAETDRGAPSEPNAAPNSRTGGVEKISNSEIIDLDEPPDT